MELLLLSGHPDVARALFLQCFNVSTQGRLVGGVIEHLLHSSGTRVCAATLCLQPSMVSKLQEWWVHEPRLNPSGQPFRCNAADPGGTLGRENVLLVSRAADDPEGDHPFRDLCVGELLLLLNVNPSDPLAIQVVWYRLSLNGIDTGCTEQVSVSGLFVATVAAAIIAQQPARLANTHRPGDLLFYKTAPGGPEAPQRILPDIPSGTSRDAPVFVNACSFLFEAERAAEETGREWPLWNELAQAQPLVFEFGSRSWRPPFALDRRAALVLSAHIKSTDFDSKTPSESQRRFFSNRQYYKPDQFTYHFHEISAVPFRSSEPQSLEAGLSLAGEEIQSLIEKFRPAVIFLWGVQATQLFWSTQSLPPPT
eukprot:TRINITY_DN5291_c0_g1_i3.p1 TRINITY_DN5291_c0_g1~~TRINITY_DN5291_c0_g1_i3.p1  ORF type:complete len:367 (+),score=48.95 TRINITY_DN5291_c0_g1_i3:898-1998(+)